MKRLAIVLMTVFLARPAYALECAPLNEALYALLAEQGFSSLSIAITAQDNHAEVFVNYRTGQWVMFMVDEDHTTACNLMQGYGWRFNLGREM